MVRVRALIVDDEPDMRLLVRLQLAARRDDVDVVGEAADGVEAVDQYHALHPDVIVLDERMPRMTGLQAAHAILSERGGARVVLYSANLGADGVIEAEDLGVAVVHKGDIDGLTALI